MQGQLDTLAQSGTAIYGGTNRPSAEVGGEGVDASDSKLLQNWAKRKIITQTIILPLIDIAKEKGKEELVNSFWNTYHCLNRFYSKDGRLFGKYCKNRICTVCSAIRKAELINKYYPELQTWNECRFLTLTIKAVPAKDLTKCINELLGAFTLIKDRYKKRSSRGGNESRLKGIRSLECNFNPSSLTYNPHFHILVNNYEIAKILNVEWLKHFGKKKATPRAQMIRKVNDLEHYLIELIKYCGKIITDTDLDKKNNGLASHSIYVSALYNILTAMSGHRIFERFGFDLLPSSKSFKPKIITEYEEWIYQPDSSDWINPETREFLVNYNPSKELISILNENIDNVTE